MVVSVPPSATGRAYFLGPGIWRRSETNKQEEAMFRMPSRSRCLAGSSLVVLHWAVLWIGDAVASLDGRGIVQVGASEREGRAFRTLISEMHLLG